MENKGANTTGFQKHLTQPTEIISMQLIQDLS